MTPAVTIITPVYDTPLEFLQDCKESIITSTYPHWEWIIVDDGSSDENLFRFYSELNDSRITVLHTNHQGVSHARNVALDIVKTDYVVFLDSDDILTSQFLEHAVALAEIYHADIVMGKFKAFRHTFVETRDVKIKTYEFASEFHLQQIRTYFQAMIAPKTLEIDGYAWSPAHPFSKLIRSSVIGEVRFNEKMVIAEDALFAAELVDLAHSVVLSDEVWTGYRKHSGSTSSISSLNSVLQQFESYKVFLEVSESHGWDEQYFGIRYLASIINRVTYHKNNLSVIQLHHYLRELEKGELFRISQGTDLSLWQLSKKRRVICHLIQQKKNWIAAMMLYLGSYLYQMRSSKVVV